jgi:hypothetical protein
VNSPLLDPYYFSNHLCMMQSNTKSACDVVFKFVIILSASTPMTIESRVGTKLMAPIYSTSNIGMWASHCAMRKGMISYL